MRVRVSKPLSFVFNVIPARFVLLESSGQRGQIYGVGDLCHFCANVISEVHGAGECVYMLQDAEGQPGG